jgi:hypothetical protein
MGPDGREVTIPDSLDTITTQKEAEFKTHMPEFGVNYVVPLYLSCESIRPLKSPIDDIPQEYKAEGLFFDPTFEMFDLNELFKRFDLSCVESLDPYRRVLYWLRLDRTKKGYGQIKCEHVIRKPRYVDGLLKSPGDIIQDPDEANYCMNYTVEYDREREGKAGYFPRSSPEVFISTNPDTKATRHQAKAQIDFEQCVTTQNPDGDENQSSTEKGIIRVTLNEPYEGEAPAFSTNHSGIYNNWPALMSLTPIPTSIYCNLSATEANKKLENHDVRQRSSAPVGWFDMYPTFGVWHVIEYCRSFGIPVTGAWVSKLFATKLVRDKFKPEKALTVPNLVNMDKGKTYGFINFSEYNDDDKQDYYTNPEWNFCVLTDYDYNGLTPPQQEALHSLTPEEGVLIMDGDTRAKLSIKGRNCGLSNGDGGGGVIIGYKYDSRWIDMVHLYKQERIIALSNWRRLITDPSIKPLLDEAVNVHAEPNMALDPFSKEVKVYSHTTEYDKAMRQRDTLEPKAVTFVDEYVVKGGATSALNVSKSTTTTTATTKSNLATPATNPTTTTSNPAKPQPAPDHLVKNDPGTSQEVEDPSMVDEPLTQMPDDQETHMDPEVPEVAEPAEPQSGKKRKHDEISATPILKAPRPLAPQALTPKTTNYGGSGGEKTGPELKKPKLIQANRKAH